MPGEWNEQTKWFIVSMCDGIGGAFLAAQLANLPFAGMAIEKEAHLRDFTHARWPQLTMVQDCSNVSAEEVVKQAVRAKCAGI